MTPGIVKRNEPVPGSDGTDTECPMPVGPFSWAGDSEVGRVADQGQRLSDADGNPPEQPDFPRQPPMPFRNLRSS